MNGKEERVIKFRAWDERKEVMHTNFFWYKTGDEGNDWIVFSSDQQKHKVEGNDKLVFDNPYFAQQLKIMQYTGLKDKNGKEIYEGDILQRTDFIAKRNIYNVEFDRGSFVACGYNGSIKVKPQLRDANYIIIGNIYQNPELLK